MADPLISRVYDLKIAGYEDSIKKVKELTVAWKAMDKAKAKLNKELEKKIKTGDTKSVTDLTARVKELEKALGDLGTRREATARETAIMAAAEERAAQSQLSLIQETQKKNEALKDAGTVVTDLNKKQADAVMSANEWANAQKTTSDETQRSSEVIAKIKSDIDQYTGTLRQNILRQIEYAQTLKENKAEQKEIEKAMQLTGVASEAQLTRLAGLKEETLVITEANKQLNVTVRNQAKEFISASGSMDEMQARLNQMQQAYEQLSDSERQSPFGKALKSQIDVLEPKIKDLEASIGRFSRNVGNYPKLIMDGFRDLGLGDVLKKQFDDVEKQLNELKAGAKALAEEYKKAGTGGAKSMEEIETQLKQNLEQQDKLKQSLGNLDSSLGNTGNVGSRVTKSISEGFKNASRQVRQLVIGYIGFNAAISGLRSGIQLAKELSDQTTALEIEMGKTAGGVAKVVEELAKLNTRTQLPVLEQIANIAAKAGVAEDKIVGVTDAIDKIKVAFGKDFGDVETGTESLVKLINIFEGTDAINGDNLLRTGNAIRTLANESVASVPFLNDFAKRMAGLKGTFDVSLPDVLGLASGFEQFGQRAETASTAIVKIIPKLAANTEKYAAVAGVTNEAFKTLINNSPVEALLAVSQGLVEGKGSVEEFSEAFADSDLGSGRVASVIGVLGSKTDEFRNSMTSATNAYQQTGNITDAFAAKNDNLAAKLDKIAKSFADAAGSKTFQLAMGAIASIITVLVGNLGILIGVVAAYGAIWVVANSQLLLAKVNTMALAVSNTVLAARTVIVSTVQTAYNAALLLFTVRARSAAAATTLLGNAMRLLPLGAVLTVLGLLIASYKVFGASLAGTTAALRGQALAIDRNNQVRRQSALIYTEEIAKIDSWILVIKSAITSADTKKEAVKELTKMNAAFGDVIKDNVIDLKKLDEAYSKVTIAIVNQANAQASANLTAQKQQKVVEITMARQIVEQSLAKGDFTEELDDSDIPKEILDIIKKTKGVQTRRYGLDKFVIVNKENQAEVLNNLKTQEEEAQAVFLSYNELKQQNELKLQNFLQQQTADTKDYQVDIQKLKAAIEALDKEINNFKGDNTDLAKKVSERKKLQDKLNELLGGGKAGSRNRGSRLSGEQRDAVKDIEALRDEQIAIEKIKFAQLKTTEEQYLMAVLKLNSDAANAKLKLLSGKNAEERKQIAELNLYKIDQQIATDKALFDLQKKQLEREQNEMSRKNENELKTVTEDPLATDQDKLRAKEQFLTVQYITQYAFNNRMLSLEKQFNQRNEDEKIKRNETLLNIQEGYLSNEKRLTIGILDDIDDATEKHITEVKLKYAKLKQDILDSNKSAGDKEAAINVVIKTENVEVGGVKLDGLNKTLEAAELLRKAGLITAERYKNIYEAAIKGQQDLNKAVEEGKTAINSFRDLIGNSLNKLFGFDEGGDSAKELGKIINQAYDVAGQAMNNYYDQEAARIQRSNDITQQRLDIEHEQAKSRAQSQEEQESLDRQFNAKKEAANKEAFEKDKKLKKQQLTMNFAMQLANIAVAASGNPLNAFTFGAAGIAQYIIQAAIATASYAMNLSSINAAKYASGGKVRKEDVKPISINNGRITNTSNISTQTNGDNILATVKTNEVILNEEQQKKLGGPSVFKSIGVPGFAGGGIVSIGKDHVNKSIKRTELRTIDILSNTTKTSEEKASIINKVVYEETLGLLQLNKELATASVEDKKKEIVNDVSTSIHLFQSEQRLKYAELSLNKFTKEQDRSFVSTVKQSVVKSFENVTGIFNKTSSVSSNSEVIKTAVSSLVKNTVDEVKKSFFESKMQDIVQRTEKTATAIREEYVNKVDTTSTKETNNNLSKQYVHEIQTNEKNSFAEKKIVALEKLAVDLHGNIITVKERYPNPVSHVNKIQNKYKRDVQDISNVVYNNNSGSVNKFVQRFFTGGKAERLPNGKIMRQQNIPVQPNGDNVFATVRTNEVILNEEQQKKLGGPSIFKSIGVPGFAGGGYTGMTNKPFGANLKAPVNPSAYLTPGRNNAGGEAQMENMRAMLNETREMINKATGMIVETSRQTNNRIDRLKVINVAKETQKVNDDLKKASTIGTL